MLRLRPLASIWSNQRHFLDRLICNKYFLSAVFLCRIRRLLYKAAYPAGQVDGVSPDDAGAWQTEGACAIIES